MRSLISILSKEEQRLLLHNLNYLHMAEIQSICKKHGIPYTITIAAAAAQHRKTSEPDRKGIILQRLRHFLKTGKVQRATCFPASVLCFDPPPKKLAASNKLFYGQYDKNNLHMIALLKNLTGGKFQDGAIARILARDFWSKGNAPTFKEFANAWQKARTQHKSPNPEWAFLTDLANKRAGTDWKKLRAQKAKKVLGMLRRLPAVPIRRRSAA
jgi:hypothetical protein